MELKVYNWEHFERDRTRYIVFLMIVLLVIILSILSNNIVWWIFVLLISGWYIFYLTKVDDTISMVIWTNSLQIDNIAFSWSSLKWFVLEYHLQKEKIYNIVIIDDKNNAKIFTLNDTNENIQNFVEELNNYIPMLEKYDQWTLDKFLRKIKL